MFGFGVSPYEELELCRLVQNNPKIAGMPKDKAMDWYMLLDNSHLMDWKELMSLFYSKFYPLHEIHQDINYIYNFWPHEGESIAQARGRLKSLMLKCPNHKLPNDIIVNNFYARLSRYDKDMLDASSLGSFTNKEVNAKWDLIERIYRNAEDWETDKGKESGINYEYDCIKSFMETERFNMLSTDTCILYHHFYTLYYHMGMLFTLLYQCFACFR